MSDAPRRVQPPEWWPERTRCAALLVVAIARTFPHEARERVAALLARDYPLTREDARIGLAFVHLSRGDEQRLAQLVDRMRDWRDVLVAAENGPDARAYFRWIAGLDAVAERS